MRTRKTPRTFAESLEQRTLFATVNFAPHTDFAVGTTPVALAAAEFTGNGDQDLAVADSTTDKVYIYIGSGTGSFTAGPVLSLSGTPTAMITGDFNGDGLPDIAVACTAGAGQTSTSVNLFLNTGENTFGVGQITTVETGASVGEGVALAAGDFNRDGHLDLVVTDYTDQQVSILSGNGNGTFASPITYSLPGHPTAITTADFNNDTYPDLAVTTTYTDNSTGIALTSNNLALLLDSSTGDFSAGPEVALGSTAIPTAVVSANLTGATTPGLVVSDSNGTATLLTNSAGTFAVSTTAPLAAGSTALAVADFDLDGNTDLVSSDGGSSTSATANSVTVVQGAGNGSVGNSYQFSVGTHPEDVVVADFNNDGKPDIATANAGGTVSILLNTTAIPLVTTTTTLVPSATVTPAGSTLTLTATVTAASVSPLTAEEVPTGSVNFYDGTTLLSTVTLTSASNVAVFSTTDLALGKNTLRAKYMGDDAYAVSTSAALTETITPTATEGPDLVGTFVSSTLPATVAPGETGTVTVRVTNQGNAIASGVITNTTDLSLDTLLDGSDTAVTVKGALAQGGVHLKPGQSELVTGTLTIPLNVPLASYYLLISLNVSNSLAESVPTNNLVVSPGTYSVADVFGTVAGRKAVALQVADSNGTVGTFRLTGPGSGTVNSSDEGVNVVLSGTTLASSLTLSTPRGEVYQLNGLLSDEALGKLSLPTVALDGTVSLNGGANSLVLDATSGSVNISGGTISSLALGSVSAATLTTAAGIRSLTDTRWASGEIIAPWIGSLISKQAFGAGVDLSGAGAAGGVTLNTASIAGAIGNASADWVIDGGINRLSALAFAPGWVLNDTGEIKSISSNSFFDSTVNASSIGAISVRGAVTAATLDSATSIGSIVIHGAVDSTTKFIALTLPKKAILDGAAVDPTTDPHFST
jgi:hypothetical protein